MTDYNHLREFADSYGLGVMVVFFLLFVLWALRPGARPHYDEAAVMIFADDEAETGSPNGAARKDGSHG